MVELYPKACTGTDGENQEFIQVEAPKRVVHHTVCDSNYQTTNNTSRETDNTYSNFTCIAPEQIPDGYNLTTQQADINDDGTSINVVGELLLRYRRDCRC